MDYREQLLQGLEHANVQLDQEKIMHAYAIAAQKHEGQARTSGEPYISHPVAVALILVEMDCDTDTVIAALLHDTLEDTDLSPQVIKRDFGADVLLIVEGVSKLRHINYTTKEDAQAENLRKMLLAMVRDIRVILIKLADRLHNMRTLDVRPPEKQRATSFETMSIFAPLADMLGMQRIKAELEDRSLYYLDPIGYAEIEQKIGEVRGRGEQVLASIKEKLAMRLDEEHYHYTIDSRIKQIYSIYNKMYGQNKTFDEIYDLFAVRIIVDEVSDCYNVLGIIHDMFKPIPGRFKDYISTPKPNMYQSLHTVVLGREAIPFEVQIRTWEMHRVAEYGIAAHWKYKGGITGADSIDSKLEWVRSLIEDQSERIDNEDFMQELKVNLFADQVFVFTPKGDVINLPAGSNPIDFAYSIHTAVGNKMIGAKVNGKIVELSYTLNNGDIVEILTSAAERGPSRDWIGMVRTNGARSKIRQYFKREKREENIERGKEGFEHELRRNRIPLSGEIYDQLVESVLARFQLKDLDELYATIGYGGLTLSKIMPKLREEYRALRAPAKEPEKLDGEVPANRASGGVIVEGIDNCLVKLSHCCNPLPGDDIVGFITRGYGVSVHKADCPNIRSLMATDEGMSRIINVSWDYYDTKWFAATLTLTCYNRIGLAADITTALANLHVMIHRLSARETKDRYVKISVTIDVKSLEHLDTVSARLKKINSVIEIVRGAN